MFVANGKTIIVHEDIDNLCNRFNDLYLRFARTYKSINSTLSGVESCYRRSGGKQNVALTCMLQSQRLLNVCGTLHDGAELLKMSKDQIRTLDQIIRQEINNTEISSLGRLTFGDTTDSDTEIWTLEEYEQYLRENDIIDKYNNGEKVDISDHDPITCGKATFNFGGGCTWYAAHRFKEVTGTDLEFISESGNNATNWDNNINREKFDVNPTSDINNIKSPAVAVKEGSGLGHVVFIEAVRDGKVYFSESSYPNTSIAGQIQCVSIENFMNQYQSIITAK